MRSWSLRTIRTPVNRESVARELCGWLKVFEVGFGFVELREETLFGLELAGVDAAAPGFDADGVFEVEHLVVEEVLDGAARSIRAVEDAADDDGVVGGVVVAQHAAGAVRAPCKRGAAEEAVEESGVERFEDLVEIVVMAVGCGDALAATGLSDVLCLFGDGLGADVAPVAVGVVGSDGLLVELGEEDVRDGAVDRLGCGFEQVGEADVEAAFAETDGGVERGETTETDVEGRNGCARAEVAVLLLEDGREGGRVGRCGVEDEGRDGFRMILRGQGSLREAILLEGVRSLVHD